jgi:hypothetical protein
LFPLPAGRLRSKNFSLTKNLKSDVSDIKFQYHPVPIGGPYDHDSAKTFPNDSAPGLRPYFQGGTATMSKLKMTTEEAFVKVLQMHGIEHAFGIIGSAFMPISDLFPQAGITFWDVTTKATPA